MSPAEKKNLKTDMQFQNSLLEITDKLQAVSDLYLNSYDEHKAFNYLIAEQFENVQSGKFVFTDGPRDGGVDFYIKDSQSYTICQCKCPDIDKLKDSSIPVKYDETPIEEIYTAIRMLNDEAGEYDLKTEVRRLRGDYHRDLKSDPDNTQLNAIVAVLGEFTDPADKRFKAYKSELNQDGIRLRKIDWKDIIHSFHALDSLEDVNIKLVINYETEKNLLRHEDYCYVLASAFDFYEAFRKYEWKLFDWNVRFEIPKSPINKKIVNTLKHSKGRRKFHHYNNGLLITCNNYSGKGGQPQLTLKGAQIINGCQTVRSICEAYESLTPQDQKEFRDKTKVQVKILKESNPEFIGELVISTNDQNPMNNRNLKSNTHEQRNIQKGFRSLPQNKRYFYVRKQGEFESYIKASGQINWFRKSDYVVGKRSRKIDNVDLAKIWYSFIGNSGSALVGGIDYFSEENSNVYATIFQSTPNSEFWNDFNQVVFQLKDSHLSSGVPSVYQYLLACCVASYVDFRRVPPKKNKDDGIKRGIMAGKLSVDKETGICISPSVDVDNYLITDSQHMVNRVVSNMREVFIELFSFLLCLKYGNCDAKTCEKLLTDLPGQSDFIQSGFDASFIYVDRLDHNFLGPSYEFLYDCVKQFYFQFEGQIKAVPRLKLHLGKRETINQLRSLVVERDKSIVGWDVDWKKSGCSFIESLPDV